MSIKPEKPFYVHATPGAIIGDCIRQAVIVAEAISEPVYLTHNEVTIQVFATAEAAAIHQYREGGK